MITVIVFLMIFIVLRRFKPSLLILSSIAFSIVITFNLIYLFKISLNMLTLGALALGFGMFVDNSIVVFENILRLRERGCRQGGGHPGSQGGFRRRPGFDADDDGRLLLLSLFPGQAQDLLSAPGHRHHLGPDRFALRLLHPDSGPEPAAPQEAEDGGPPKEDPRFETVLGVPHAPSVEVLLIVAALLFGAYVVPGRGHDRRWYPWYSKEYLYVRVGMPPGTDIARTDETIREFEEKVMDRTTKRR